MNTHFSRFTFIVKGSRKLSLTFEVLDLLPPVSLNHPVASRFPHLLKFCFSPRLSFQVSPSSSVFVHFFCVPLIKFVFSIQHIMKTINFLINFCITLLSFIKLYKNLYKICIKYSTNHEINFFQFTFVLLYQNSCNYIYQPLHNFSFSGSNSSAISK